MNEIQKTPKRSRTTQAADGLPRRCWSVAELDRLIEIGFFAADDHFELIEGEMVPMSPKGNRHENVKSVLLDLLYRRASEDVMIGVELGWRPGGDNYVEPDLVILPRTNEPSAVVAGAALPVVEIAKSSLQFDLGRKAELYASLGVRDYWVINAETLDTRIHREPSADGYRLIADLPPQDTATPLFVPYLALRLAGLGVA